MKGLGVDVAGFYDRYAERYDLETSSGACQRENRKVRAVLRRAGAVGPGTLDLGCGTGLLLDLCPVSPYLGVDISEGMLRVARRKHPTASFRRVDLVETEGRGLGLWPHVVALFGVLNYVGLEKMVRTVRNTLPPDGRALLMSYAPGRLVRENYMEGIELDEESAYAPDELAGAFADAGLERSVLLGMTMTGDPRLEPPGPDPHRYSYYLLAVRG